MSVTHPSGSDLESMNEFYDKKILRAVTLVLQIKRLMLVAVDRAIQPNAALTLVFGLHKFAGV